MARNDVEIKVVLKGNAAKQYKQSMGAIRRENKKTETSMKSMKSSAMGFKTVIVGISGYLSGKTIGSLINTQKTIDKVRNALEVATGSTERAVKEQQFLTDESKRLNLELKTTSIEYGKLAAATRGSALEGEATRQIFLATAEASTALGLSADETSGALKAFSQIISKGTVQSEELRGQLAERLPGAYRMAAEAMGLTTAQLGKQLELGKVTALDMLPKLAAEMRKTYGGQALKAAEDMNGKIQKLNTTIFELQKKFLDSGGRDMLKKGFDKLTKAAQYVSDNMDKIIKNIDLIIAGGKVFFEVWATTKIIGIANSFGTLVTTVTKLNPVLAAATAAFVAMEASIYFINKETEKLEGRKGALSNLADAKELQKAVLEYENMNSLVATYEKHIMAAGGNILKNKDLIDKQREATLKAAEAYKEMEKIAGQGTRINLAGVDAVVMKLEKQNEQKRIASKLEDKARLAAIAARKESEVPKKEKMAGPAGKTIDMAVIEEENKKEYAAQLDHQMSLLALQDESRQQEADMERLKFQLMAEEGEVSLQNTIRRKELERATIDSINKKYNAIEDAEEKRQLKLRQAGVQMTYSMILSNLTAATAGIKQLSGLHEAMAIAQATQNTYASAVAAYKSTSEIPMIGPALAPAAAASAVAAGLANVAKIVSAADGGMFSGPVSGYPAVLHGNEAVIPLKNGAVPVQIEGGVGGGNTIINNYYGSGGENMADMTEPERLQALDESNQELVAMGL